MSDLYISRVVIKNYRNFKEVDVKLKNKQVIIGENNVGKTNFLRAIQLILDPTFSDEDRMLEETDFWDGIESPIENKAEILIKLYINNFKNNNTILTMLDGATVIEEGEEQLLLTYKYYPVECSDGRFEYTFNIFQGEDEARMFSHEHRKYLNVKVIKALRDVENEMKNSKNSPITKLLKGYEINKERLKEISERYKETGSDILKLDELVDLTKSINKRFSEVLSSNDFAVSLKTLEIEPSKILSSLKLLLSNRNTSEISLGINNVLYISLILQLLQDKNVPTFLLKEKFDEYKAIEGGEILEIVYSKNTNDNYFLKDSLSESETERIKEFMLENNSSNTSVTILAIEEPEAHLHPTFQRLIYKDVIKNSSNSVLLTTHSTHITSVSPIKTIVHLQIKKEGGTLVSSTSNILFEDKDLKDLERFVDVKRGEIYLGRGVILVEGISEEYLVPKFADALDKPLDEKGIIVCNIDSTNFLPYVKLLKCLGIHFVTVTDGDLYYVDENQDKVYHISREEAESAENKGYDGLERINKLISDLEIENDIPEEIEIQESLFKTLGFFVGNSTLEIEIMSKCTENTDKELICNIFNELTIGGDRQKSNFKKDFNECKYWECLKRIEGNGIGKGRFAQRLSNDIKDNLVPEYIKEAIEYIYQKVD